MTTTPGPRSPYLGDAAAGGRPPSVGGYELLARIGEGGMGVVHLARRPAGDRVALKVLRPHIVGDDETRRRLAREVASLSRIRSRWVAEILDADPWGPVPYVATRYVPGLSLDDHVVEEGPVRGDDLVWLAAGLAEGLTAVHAAGVLHRDVKPSNVLMEGRTPILIDFGLARVAEDPRLTSTGWLLGTPGYLAPEILYGEDATAASDVHSWAATVAYAGTGHPPFGRGPAMAVMDRVRRGEHDLRDLPADLRRVVEAALDPEPGRRPTLAALLAWLRPQAASTGRRPPVQPAPTPREDLHTLPLAHLRPGEDPTDVLDPVAGPPRAATRLLPAYPSGAHQWGEQGEPMGEQPAGASAWPPRTPLPERLRRAALLLAGALAVGAVLAAYPVPALATLLLVVWVLRSGSMAAAAAGDRRRLRGRRWYDGAQLLLGAPWHLVRSIGGTLVLALWSLGLALAGALLGYAVAAATSTVLLAGGVALAAALWSGPGGHRVRSPLARVVDPAARSARSFLPALVLVLGVAGLATAEARSGTGWTPPGDGALFEEWVPGR